MKTLEQRIEDLEEAEETNAVERKTIHTLVAIAGALTERVKFLEARLDSLGQTLH